MALDTVTDRDFLKVGDQILYGGKVRTVAAVVTPCPHKRNVGKNCGICPGRVLLEGSKDGDHCFPQFEGNGKMMYERVRDDLKDIPTGINVWYM